MNCEQAKPLIPIYADGELDAAHSVELERHLKTCATCAAENNSRRSLTAALRQPALHFAAPAALRKNVRQLARAAEATTPGMNPSRLWRWLAFGATALAVLTLLLRPAGISERDELLNEVVASHVRSLQAEHLTDVASSDQHTVKPWFDGKLDFAPDVKDFAAQGFPLVGGRLDYFQNRAVAALVYRHNKHLINVFIWPAANVSDAKLKIENRRGYSILNRAANGLQFYLVSDLNQTELGELAGLLTR